MGGQGRFIGAAGLVARNNHQSKMMKIHNRLMVTKLPNRAAVHGTETVNVEDIGSEIDKGKQEKEQKIEEVETKVDSHINQTIEEKEIDSPPKSTTS